MHMYNKKFYNWVQHSLTLLWWIGIIWIKDKQSEYISLTKWCDIGTTQLDHCVFFEENAHIPIEPIQHHTQASVCVCQ